MLPNGYGAFKFMRVSMPASRVAWILAHGAIPDGLFVLHKCDVRRCCNPDHLFLGTHAENMADMARKGRSVSGERNPAHTHPETHGKKKLTPEQVVEIRALYAQGVRSGALVKQFGVGSSSIHDIVRRRTWVNL